MNDRDSLLTAILAAPDEDTPRLMFADWLQENDETERAEFIRLQCRFEQIAPRSAEGKRLAKREKELQVALFGHLDALAFQSITLRRGFVGSITSGFLHFRDVADQLRLEDAPTFELILEYDERDSALLESSYDDYLTAVGELGERPALRRSVSLDLPCLGPELSHAILQSPQFMNLRRLNFPGNEAGPCIESVASPTFANLRWANFYNSDSAADCPSIVPLAECPHLANLEHLDFGACEQWDDGAIAVAKATQWNRLRYLSLSVSSFSVNAVATLFATHNLPVLTELDLAHTFNGPIQWNVVGNGDPFMPAIVDSPLFVRLSKLSLRGNGITDDGAKVLAASQRPVNLTRLDLADNPIGPVGRRSLHKRFGKDVCVFERPDDD